MTTSHGSGHDHGGDDEDDAAPCDAVDDEPEPGAGTGAGDALGGADARYVRQPRGAVDSDDAVVPRRVVRVVGNGDGDVC